VAKADDLQVRFNCERAIVNLGQLCDCTFRLHDFESGKRRHGLGIILRSSVINDSSSEVFEHNSSMID